MARYSNYGSLDNPIVDEGDFSFSRINARLRPDQLSPSEVAMSSNGRMDINGAWQTRKGYQHFGSSLVTNVLALTLPFTLDDAGTPPVLDDDVVNAAYGSCLFSDPSSNNEEYIAIAANSKVFLVNLTTGATTEIAYPVGFSISSKVSMLQAFNYIFIFRDGETALQWDGDTSWDSGV
jgi:hypothetical protein